MVRKLVEQSPFADESVRAVLEACRIANRAFVGGGHDRAHSRIRLTEEFDQLEAVMARHLKIRDDEVGLEEGQPVGRPGRVAARSEPLKKAAEPRRKMV